MRALCLHIVRTSDNRDGLLSKYENNASIIEEIVMNK